MKSNDTEHAKGFVRERLNIKVDGGTPTNVLCTVANFSYITRVIVTIKFPDTTLEWGNFGDASALTNGFQFYYDDVAISEAIKTNSGMLSIAYDGQVHTDEGAGKQRIITARWTFARGSPPYGLDVRNNETFYIRVSDDLTATPTYDNISEISVEVQGFLFDS